MTSESEGRAYPARIDRCSLMREEANYHRGIGLEAALDVGSEYDLFVPNG